MVSRSDVLAGRVQPKVLENGAVSPPMAQVNEMTLREHQEALRRANNRPLSEAEIAQIHPDEAQEK